MSGELSQPGRRSGFSRKQMKNSIDFTHRIAIAYYGHRLIPNCFPDMWQSMVDYPTLAKPPCSILVACCLMMTLL